jgi:hypothetical protein
MASSPAAAGVINASAIAGAQNLGILHIGGTFR